VFADKLSQEGHTLGENERLQRKKSHLWLSYEVGAGDVSVQPLPASHVVNINHVMTRHFCECCNSMRRNHIKQNIFPLIICFRGTYSEGKLTDRRAVQEGI
jgi:hypothetical protein